MPDVASAKIRRKIYRFEIKKRYPYVGHYKTKERPPIERIKDQLRKFMAPKKEEKKIESLPISGQPPGGFNFVIMGAAVFVAIIILALAWIYLTVQAAPSAGAFMPAVDKPFIDAVITKGEVLTSGDRNQPTHVSALYLDYNTKNLQNLTVQLTPYETRVPSEVFVLISERSEETKSYPDFIRDLRANLAKRQIILNEMTLKQLSSLPEGATIIVPSGSIPKELLGFDSPVDLDELGDRGMVLVYIGQPFTYMLNGSLSVITPKDTLKDLPVSFDEAANLKSAEGFHLKQPLYRASASGGWGEGDLAYGTVSVLTKGDGALLMVPQTLDFGWDNSSIAADDIARIIFETPWAIPSAATKNYTFNQTGASGNLTDFSGARYFFTDAFEKANATVKMELTGYSSSSSNPVQETIITHTETVSPNGLFIEQSGRVIPYNVTKEAVRMNARLREPMAAQPNTYLVVYDVNGTEMQNFPQGNVNLQTDKSFDVLIYVDKGEYLVRLIDDNEHVYAQTLMNVVSLDIAYMGQDQKTRSVYYFNIKMGEDPYTLNSVSVTVDKGKYGKYEFNNVDNVKVDVGAFTGGDTLPLGNHSFEFVSGDFKNDVNVNYARMLTIFDNPMFWVVGIFTMGIVGIGIFFARQEDTFYAIDIPDFPPVARTKIPLSPDAVLGIFEKINETYRWQNTPLTATEVKNGFKDIFVQGKPIVISDYNVEYLLDELEKKGRVKESLGYYGLSTWADKTNLSVDHMALMRRLRDICVNNAVPFTGVGESSEADSVITVVGQQMFVHFYDKSQDVSKIMGKSLATISSGITILLFKNPSERDAFQAMLSSSPSVAPLISKMEAEGGSLQFLTADEFEKMLLEFKSM
jgi:hypothetical protein